MRIRLDPDACVGHGRCYAVDPVTFGPDDLGHCEVLDDGPGAEDLDRVRLAVRSCPEAALRIDE